MKKVFKVGSEYRPLTLNLIREANILLDSNKDSSDYEHLKETLYSCIKITRIIDNSFPQNVEDINLIYTILNSIWEKGILTPLTLKDDEFYKETSDGIAENIRYRYIIKKNGIMYNTNAYKGTVRNSYNHVLKCKIYNKIKGIAYNPKLYISKGGVITGEYIKDCIIRQDIVNRHSFTIQSIVNIPVSVIYDNDKEYVIVDHREPKLKTLKEFYDVVADIDLEVKKLKLNIRKYKKD